MQTAYISFCDKQALNIKSSDVKRIILDRLESHGIKIIDKHHETYSDKHMNRIERIPHLLAIKSNGNPYYLFMTRINFVNTVLFIDKKVQMGYALPRMIITRLAIRDEALFDGSLLEGEMIKSNTGSWLFLLSDLLVLNNKYLGDEDLIKRTNKMYQILNDSYVPTCTDMFCIQVKKMFECKDMNYMIEEFIPSLPYTCRGIYCKPLYLKFKDILYNFDDSLIKSVQKQTYKEMSHFLSSPVDVMMASDGTSPSSLPPSNIEAIDTIDVELPDDEAIGNPTSTGESGIRIFQVQKSDTPDLYFLYDDTNHTQYIGNACVDSMRTSKFLSGVFKNHSLTSKTRLRCKKTTNDNFSNVWVPYELITSS